VSGDAPTLHGTLRRAAEATPGALAVADPEEELTYSELEARAGRITAALRELGVGPGDRVGIAAAKSARTIAALYGVMRAGAVYVPVDPLSPPPRATRILDDAGCAALCGDAQRLERLGEGDRPTLDLADARLDSLDPDPGVPGGAGDLAYLLYTSGSTGAPKGVMLTHANGLSFARWTAERFGVRAEDRVASHAPFHFDLSIFDLYGAAVAGASVHVLAAGAEAMGASMAEAIRTRALSVWYSVPSALALLADTATADDLVSLRVVLFAGEVFPMKHLRRLRALVPGAVLGNLYGPTETNVCTYHVVESALPDGERPLPIGRACENDEVFALDDAGRPVAEGEVGELWVRGATVMRGYWGDAELTNSRLRRDPRPGAPPGRAYRTGDLVRRLPGDAYDFVGRRDHQVKSRGYRIELGEIETVLNGHEHVREAAVVAVPDARLGSRLVGFVGGGPGLEEMALRRLCAESLPRYMVPGAIVVEAELPHTSTGKIDRQELERRAAAQ
jgi:amino acid adenylation domain-containing protein